MISNKYCIVLLIKQLNYSLSLNPCCKDDFHGVDPVSQFWSVHVSFTGWCHLCEARRHSTSSLQNRKDMIVVVVVVVAAAVVVVVVVVVTVTLNWLQFRKQLSKTWLAKQGGKSQEETCTSTCSYISHSYQTKQHPQGVLLYLVPHGPHGAV